jgi:hypothetical protein
MDEPTVADWTCVLGADPDEPRLAHLALQRAILLVWVRTKLAPADYPADPMVEKIARTALFETAKYMVDSQELQEQLAGGLASERIGSWNYTLRSEARVLNLMDSPTGVEWLDIFLGLLVTDGTDLPWSTGQDVFDADLPVIQIEGRETVAPSMPAAFYADPSMAPNWWQG